MNEKKSQYIALEEYYHDALEYLGMTEDLHSIFEGENARKFISRIFSNERKNKKISNCLKKITPFRARHTLSAYLLGITIRNNLSIDTRSWRRLPGENTDKGSFLLFWSWICLFHDIGYYYENKSNEYSHCTSVELLMQELGVKESLLSVSSSPDLIKNYYKMRIETGNRLDHGIVGAILLYDGLMSLAEKEEYKYSKINDYKGFFVKICDAIAVHNMWRATDDKKEIYSQYDLYELIPQQDNKHIIFLKDNSLLFLLGLVDTIDLIKAFSNDERSKEVIHPKDVLSDAQAKFINYGKDKRTRKKISIMYPGASKFDDFAKKLIDEREGLHTWLGVWSEYHDDELIIELDTVGSVND